MSIEENLATLSDKGFCVLRAHLSKSLIHECREAFWLILLDYIEQHGDAPNRGPHRYFLPMPFTPPCFAPEFFFDARVLSMVHGVMDGRIVADQ